MRDILQKYLKILAIEIEDLQEDLTLLLEINQLRKNRGEITDYVFMENVTVLKKELSCVKDVLHTIGEVEAQRYVTMVEMIDDIDARFRHRTEHGNFPEAVYTLVKRKLDKVAKYVLETER